MALHPSTFNYLNPTQVQIEQMQRVRDKFSQFIKDIDTDIPEGPDKTYLLRQLRDTAMWANIAITRNPDGSPRQ